MTYPKPSNEFAREMIKYSYTMRKGKYGSFGAKLIDAESYAKKMGLTEVNIPGQHEIAVRVFADNGLMTWADFDKAEIIVLGYDSYYPETSRVMSLFSKLYSNGPIRLSF